jgi:putative acetyltransferase
MALADFDRVQLHPWNGSREQQAALAGIWRRAWCAAQGHRAVHVEAIDHWLARVQAEFVAPAEVHVAERGGQPLAFMVMLPQRAYVAQLYVDPHRHGQGLGRRLLDVACRRMPAGWRLHVATANAMGQCFYERYGLSRGAVDRHPATGRERVAFAWRPPVDGATDE